MSVASVSNGLGTAELAGLVSKVASMPEATDDAERIERVRHLEQLKAAVTAAQLAETAAFAASRRAAAAAAGVARDRRDRGVAAQVAMARRCSPHAAQRFVGMAVVLTRELPETYAALRAGITTEWRAALVARETACLSLEHRSVIDRELAGLIEGLGDRQVETRARQSAYRLDPSAALARSRAAAADRRVTIRPAPDTMARLSILAPVAQAVAGYAALTRAADTAVATGANGTTSADGDAAPRSRAQMMTDLAIERLTGQATAAAVPVEVELVISTDTLLHADIHPGARQPGLLSAPGQAPVAIPAPLARELVADAPRAWLRRLFSAPDTGQLVTMETRARLFTKAQRAFPRHRDGTCATVWCDAPVRHADHVTPHQHSGRTRLADARGLCEACNHAAQAAGWTFVTRADGSIITTTPTGHTYRRPPPTPVGPPPDDWLPPIDQMTPPPVDYIDWTDEWPAAA